MDIYIDFLGIKLDPFGDHARNKAIEHHNKELGRYHELGALVTRSCQDLFKYRNEDVRAVLEECDRYVSHLKNAPHEFEKTVAALRIELQNFDQSQAELNAAVQDVNWTKLGATAGGVAVGAGIVTFAPTAAMAIATTFGTASTGAAISTLTGAAATNAALAWLGGGALVAGGGGMAAGNALLALAGPVGWAIGGAFIVGGLIHSGAKNGEITKKAYAEAEKIMEQNKSLERKASEVGDLLAHTRRHNEGISELVSWMWSNAPKNYLDFNQEQRQNLKSLMTNANSLSALINRRLNAD